MIFLVFLYLIKKLLKSCTENWASHIPLFTVCHYLLSLSDPSHSVSPFYLNSSSPTPQIEAHSIAFGYVCI